MATIIYPPAPALSPPGFRARIAAARARTDELFDRVDPSALYGRPIPERHRMIFYLGHLEAFDWNLIGAHALERPALDPTLDRLFAFGIDPVAGDLPADSAADWPARDEIVRYVQRVRAALDELLERSAWSALPSQLDPSILLHVAIEHRLMHAETLAYMLHQLPPSRKLPGPIPAPPFGPPPTPAMIEVPAGIATLGMTRASPEFGWDNEFEAHSVRVPAFAIDVTKVTAGEYLAFVAAGGYADPAHWTAEDWDWNQGRGITHPSFWIPRDGEWLIRTQFGAIPLPHAWPVYVSHAEASAYARWAGKRLPTEAEWHRAAFGTKASGERFYPWGNDPPRPEHGHFDFQGWDPGGCASRRTERVRRPRDARQRLGVDPHALRAVPGVHPISVLSRLLGGLLRWPPLRHEGSIPAHRGVHAAAIVSQLVPGALRLHLCRIPLRAGLNRITSEKDDDHVSDDPELSQRSDPGSGCGIDSAGSEGAAVQIPLR